MEFRMKHPFTELIDSIEAVKRSNLHYRDEKHMETIINITGLLRAACHADFTTEEPYMPTTLRDAFNNDDLPYRITTKVNHVIYIDTCEDKCKSTVHAIDMIVRYLRGIENKDIQGIEFNKQLHSLTTLYNYAFGPFYPYDQSHTYNTKELNLLFYHRKIPYMITSTSMAGPLGMVLPYYCVKECNYE